jgi:hypothetical protein
MTGSRHMPHAVVRHDVACQSDRHGAKLVLIVIHDTEGGNIPHSARDLAGLGDFFDRIGTQASSTVATDEDGNSARYVDDDKKAWAQAFYNPVALSIEQIGFATDNWRSKAKEPQLQETARWIALWNKRYGIPIRRARVSRDGRVLRSGVIQHRWLGTLGGGHHDVSAAYPMRKVLRYARAHRKAMG